MRRPCRAPPGDMALAAAAVVVVMVVVMVPAGVSNPDPPHVVLLLDVSTSMASQNRIEKIKVAVRGWIENHVPEGVQLSLWKFTNDAQEIKSKVIDDTLESRQDLMNSIPDVESGISCIACAIETILKHVSKKFSLLLITDGNDKYLEHDIYDLTAKLQLSQCKTIAMLVGNSLANVHLLEELTNGTVTHVADTNTVLGLLDSLQAALQNVKPFSVPINIFEDEFTSSEAHFNVTFSVDNTVAQNVCINLYYWPYFMPFSVELTTPKGDIMQISSVKLASGYIQNCLLPEIAGQWKFHSFAPTFNKFIALQVTANSNTFGESSAITFSCWIEMGENYSSVWGSIQHGKYMINETKISVDIIAEDGEVIKQELYEVYADNAETFPSQNLYARKHFNITRLGYCSARCWAAGQLLQGTNIITEPQKFSRVAWAGTFRVDQIYSRLKIPSDIKDFLVSVEPSMEKCSIVMEFTAPANAIKYKLLLSSSLYDIMTGGELILATVPGNAGTKENIAFRIPVNFSQSSLYIALSALGKNGIEGEISNIVPVMCLTKQINVSTAGENISLFPETPSASTPVGTSKYNLSTLFISQENSSNTSFPLDKTYNIALTTYNSSLSADADKSYQEDKKGMLIVTEVSSSTITKDFVSNASDVGNNSSVTVTIITHEDPDDSSSIGVGGIIGIVVLILLIVAVAGTALYKKIYERKRFKYEVASRNSESAFSSNNQDNL